jgi:hypothetical protein
MDTTGQRFGVRRLLRAYYRLQFRWFVTLLGSFGFVPRPLAAAALRLTSPRQRHA